MYCLLSIIILLFSVGINAQSKIETLEKQLKFKKAEDTTFVRILNSVSNEYRLKGNYTKAIETAKKALFISKKIKDELGTASALNNSGMVYDDQGNYNQALGFYNKSAAIALKINIKNKSILGSIYNNIGVVNRNLGNYPEALNYYYKAMRIYESTKDEFGISSTYGNIGVVYYDQGNLKESLDNQLASLAIKERIHDEIGLSNTYGNIGIIYDELEQYKKGLRYHFKGLAIQKRLKDLYGIANSYNNIGVSYEELKQLEKAKEYFSKALKIRIKLKDKDGEAAAYLNLGYVYTSLKMYDLARQCINKSLKLSVQIGSKNGAKYAYDKLSQLEQSLGNHETALQHYKTYIAYRDSLNNEETEKASMQAAMDYEFDKKSAIAQAKYEAQMEKQQEIANERSRKQKILIWSIVSVLVLAVTFAIFMVRRFRLTQAQKEIIENQKELVEQQKSDIEEKHKEITDSIRYAKRIQDAILPSKSSLDTYLKDYFVLYLPKDVVAGDFYWVEHVENTVFVAAADCTGHGVPGAMMSVVCSNALTKALYETSGVSTGSLLDRTREFVRNDLSKSGDAVKDGMDISVAKLDLKSRTMQWSGANNPLWVVRSGECIEVKHDKQPIGYYELTKPFTTHEIELIAGDQVYLFTDGFQDQFGGKEGKKFKARQLKEKLLQLENVSMETQKTALQAIFEEWKSDYEQIDDVCIIGIRI